MLNAPKSFVGLVIRKTAALMLAYCFLANSVWSQSIGEPSVTLASASFSNDPTASNTSPITEDLRTIPPSGMHVAVGQPSAGMMAASLGSVVGLKPTVAEGNPIHGFADDDDDQATSCTLHSSQPSDNDDDDDSHRHNDYRHYHRHDYKYRDDDDHHRSPNPPIVSTGIAIFGPQTYTRPSQGEDEFDSAVTVPAWTSQPFFLHLVNGDAGRNHRVFSGSVSINGARILGRSSLNRDLASADCSITLASTDHLRVVLEDTRPGTFVSITLLAKSVDLTPPVLTINAPVNNSAINTPQPHFDIHYQDLVGPGEPAASGVDVTTLQVLLDGVDRTSLFTKRATEATADLPQPLALSQGQHTVAASIKDFAGNLAQATATFEVDTTPPTVQIMQPAGGSYLNSTTTKIQLVYSDDVAINVSSLKVIINNVDSTQQFSATAGGAIATVQLPQGSNQIVATISDTAGNQTTATDSFNVDTTPPTIRIVQPPPGSVRGVPNVDFLIQFNDDQAVDLTSLQVTIDGGAVNITPSATSASGAVTLGDGNHTLAASIKDKAGNPASTSSAFLVDTTAPDVHVLQPLNGAVLNNATPQAQIQFGSAPDLDMTTFKVFLDGVDITASFTVSGSMASGTLPHLSDGTHGIDAQIAKVTGKVGTAHSGLLVDTVPPEVAIDSIGFTNSATPTAVVRYSDSGSGVNLGSLHILLDGADVTASFSAGVSSAQGVLSSGPGLAEGSHTLQATIADNAGNVSPAASIAFVEDRTPPTASFTAPANNSFINTATPAIALTYADSGSGVDLNSLHIFLQQGTQPETEITSQFNIGPTQASAAIAPSSPLVTGTYHLRATLADRAGNTVPVSGAAAPVASFVVDLTPPTYTIASPAPDSFLSTATPTFVVVYDDDNGVDTSRFVLNVDGTDRTNRLHVTETGASGPLPATDALSDGPHSVSVKVFDRAGNEAPETSQSFFVDTTPPVIAITTPANGSYTNNNLLPITVTYSDPGGASASGIDPASFQLNIDGVDQSKQFIPGATGATGSPSAPLANGSHTLTATVKDIAGNISAAATISFIVSTIPPAITITQPADGSFTNATSVAVSGTVTDAVPVTVTVEQSSATLQGTSFSASGIALGAGPAQDIHVTALDVAGNSATTKVTVNIDRVPPTITGAVTPAPNAANWNNTPVTVSFACSDAGSGVATCPSPIQLNTEGANQQVTGTAADKAGNTAQTTVSVNIDLTPPVVTATPTPAPNTAGWNTSDVVVNFTCSDSLSGVASCPPPATVSTEGKNQPVSGTATDRAGNTASAAVTLNVEKSSPTIAASLTPSPNAAGWNNTAVTVNFSCSASVSDIVSCQPPVAVSTEGKGQGVTGNVTDQAGKTNTATATVNIDLTAPLITASAAPPANGAGWNNTNVVVTYTCSDSLSGIATCPLPATVSTEGAAQKISAAALDVAGNSSTPATTVLNIDKTPPTITVSAAPPANAAGWNNSSATVTYACNDTLSGIASCPSPTVVGTEGQNQLITGQAVDIAGNTATGSITLSIDETAPTIVQLSTPDHISPLRGGQVSATVTDNFSVAQVVISVNANVLGTFNNPPYQTNLTVPSGAKPGDTLTVTVVATDQAGNTQTASRGVRVAADGIIVGQVLSDVTSFPMQGANVQLIAANGSSGQTDDHGRYSFQASDAHVFISTSNNSPVTTTVEREVMVQEGVGTVPVDARLTPLAASASPDSNGTVKAGNIVLSVPAATAAPGTTFQLTPLSAQGLPGLLPLGWAPLAAFDLRASSAVTNLPANIASTATLPAHLVSYSSSLHAWTMVMPNLTPANGAFNFTVPSAGSYALVAPDSVTPPIPIPNAGDSLKGVDMQIISPAASTIGDVSPRILPAAGGTSTATLGVQVPTPVPSGTVIQANISERFSLTSGDTVAEENRSEDIVLYQTLASANASLGAVFPIVPSQKFSNAQLLTGKIHLDILAGREGVRGQPGGNDPLTLSDGNVTLSVPGGALATDTDISVHSVGLSDFVPTSGGLNALQDVVVDFSGAALTTAAQLSMPAVGLNQNDTFLLAQVQRINGVPHLVTAALAQINGATLVSVASPGLPGIIRGGEYVFYDISSPVGFVQGVTSASSSSSGSSPVSALVLSDSLAIAAISNSSGAYTIPVLAGTANLKASVPNTNLVGGASAQVTAGQTTPTNITLTGTVTNATVSPADGSLGVPTSTVISITMSAPLNPQSIAQSNLVLLKGTGTSGTPVAIQPFVLSTSGTVLSFAPQNNLDPATQYTIQISGLADAFGSAVVVPSSSFTTKAAAQLNFDPDAITFGFPDQNGNIHVSAPAASLPAGTKVLIIDQNNGIVLSLTVSSDGSLSGDFQGTINDLLQVKVTDPNGSTVNFTRSQFVAPDGSVAVGPGGGTVTGQGGVAMIIPSGALDQGAVFKVQTLGIDAFPQVPTLPNSHFGGGMQINAPSMPVFKEEVKLAFPKPADAPDGAFYYVYRQLTDAGGHIYSETIDHAFVQGSGASAQVVTASPPFCGYRNSATTFNADFNNAVVAGFSPIQDAITKTFFIWDFDPNQPGVASQGLVVGKALQEIPPGPGETLPTFKTLSGVTVWMGSSTTPPTDGFVPLTTTSDSCGTFAIFDPQFGGGPRTVTAQATDGTILHATANEVNGIQVDDVSFDVTAGLERLYRNIGRVNFTFPVKPVPPAAPIDVHFYALDAQGFRQPATTSVFPSGTPLVIAVKTNLQLDDANINGKQLTAAKPDGPDNPSDPMPPLDWRIIDPNSTDPQEHYITGTPDVYTLTIDATDLSNNDKVSVSRSFLVVAPGGNNNSVTASGPVVLSSVPADGAAGVRVETFITVLFSEPVTNVPASVSLIDASGKSPLVHLIGTRANSTPSNSTADPLTASDVITSLTIQADPRLTLNNTYTLTLKSGIVDQNKDQNGNPNPRPLKPFTATFSTFAPAELDQSQDTSALTRLAIIGKRAYGGEWINEALSALDVVDISDPANPTNVGMKASIPGHTVDAAGLKSAPVTRCLIELPPGTPCANMGSNAPLVAVAATVGATDFSVPSNIWFYDVSQPDQPVRVGAVSATSSAVQDGSVLRIVMKDQFVFAATLNKGLQMIDMQQAINEYQQTAPDDFGKAIAVDGDGFALDAVVNTIPVPINVPAGGGTVNTQAIMLDLKVGDFATPPSNPGNPGTVAPFQSLIVATGRLPLVVADPQQAGLQGVLYPPVDTFGTGLLQAPLQSPNGSFKLQHGNAVALATVSTTDSQGNAVQQPIAVVVGTGTVTNGGVATPFAGLLAVVDMTTPASPVARGFVQLVDSSGTLVIPTDVVVTNGLAIVGTGLGEVLIVDVTDPTAPIISDEVPGNFGIRLALTDAGVLVTSAPSGNHGGVHTVAAQPVAGISPVLPLLANKVVQGGQTWLQTLVKLRLNLSVFSATPLPDGAILDLLDDGNRIIGHQVFDSKKDTGGALWTQLPGKQVWVAQRTFDRGILLTPPPDGTKKRFTAILTVPTKETAAPLISEPLDIFAGSIQIKLDFNNDTLINGDDDTAQAQGNAFAFWEADPSQYRDPNGARIETERGLVDFARVRLVVDAMPMPDDQLRVFLTLKGVGFWDLVKNVGFADGANDARVAETAKNYFNDQIASANQLAQNRLAGACSSGSGSGFLTPSQTVLNSLCVSDADPDTINDSIELVGLSAGKTYDLLFRCRKCPLDPNRTLSIKVRDYTNLNSPPSELEMGAVKVDIRPLTGWIGVQSARVNDPPDGQLAPVDPWSNTLPSNANVTVLVHGMNVDIDDAEGRFFPVYTKRLYWSGHQVLPVQKDANGKPAYTVGIEWRGDFVRPDWGALTRKLKGLFFPDDEFRALQTGVPLAHFFNTLSDQRNTVTVIAHSLGNVVVNSALTRPDLDAGAVSQYMMNEPALSLEAFTTSDVFAEGPQFPPQSELYEPNVLAGGTRKEFMQDHLTQQGFPDDQIWIDLLQNQILPMQYGEICHITELGTTVCLPNARKVFDDYYNAAPFPDRNAHYRQRWRAQKHRVDKFGNPTKAAPDDDSSLQTGPWSGFFSGNLTKTKIYNSFNFGDCIVNNPWVMNQLTQKPDRGALDSLNAIDYMFTHANGAPFPDAVNADNVNNQAWLIDEPPYPAKLWGNDPKSTHYGIHRQWAELAFWYPQRSGPAGASNGKINTTRSDGTTESIEVFTVNGEDRTLDFTSIGKLDPPPDGPTTGRCFDFDTFIPGVDALPFANHLSDNLETHSYMLDKPFWKVWPAYKAYFSKLDSGRKDPDPPAPIPKY